MPEADPYVYQIDENGLLILQESTAERLALLDKILYSSKTFGEYAARCGAADELEYWVGSFDADDWDFDDDEPFDLGRLPGVADGYFPPNPQTIMLDELSDEIFDDLQDIAIYHDAMGGVPHMEIPASRLPEVLAVFKRIGIPLIERPTVSG